MPASAVFSPVPVTSTRREPEPFTVPAMTCASRTFRDGSRLAGDHRFVDVARAVAHDAVGGNARAGADEHQVSLAEVGGGDLLGPLADDPHRRVGEKLGQFLQCALRLGNRSHLDPVAEDHDRDERRQLPPQVHAREAECDRQAEDEGDGDRQRDERHHAGPAVGELALWRP